jgi:hypothetical protein
MKTDLSKAAFVVTYYPYGVKAKNWPAEAPKHKFLSHGPCNAARTLSQCGIAHQSGSQTPGKRCLRELSPSRKWFILIPEGWHPIFRGWLSAPSPVSSALLAMRDGLDAILRNERKIAVVLGPGTWGLNFMMSLEIFLCCRGECAHTVAVHTMCILSPFTESC